MNSGYGGALFAYDDPYLAQAIAMAQQEQIPYGIWADPHGRNPQQFASLMAQLYGQYRPEIMVPDIEFIGKGNQGSPGWNYNEELARLWQQYLPGVRTAVTVMPNQRDFNYEAWNRLGAEWLPQAYGANPLTDVFDPRQIVQTLIDRGVDPSLISPILGPGHRQGYGGSALWTIDDFAPYGRLPFPKASGPGSPSQDIGGSAARTLSSNAPGPVRATRLSQSTEQVAQQGLKWGGRNFASREQFAKYLSQRGRSYSKWAEQHPYAAAGLPRRNRGGSSSGSQQ